MELIRTRTVWLGLLFTSHKSSSIYEFSNVVWLFGPTILRRKGKLWSVCDGSWRFWGGSGRERWKEGGGWEGVGVGGIWGVVGAGENVKLEELRGERRECRVWS